MSVRQFVGMPPKAWWMALAAWIALTAVVLAIWVSFELKQQSQSFEQESARLFAAVQQKLDQNEAVLTGLEAMLAPLDDDQFGRIRGYARQMLARYPHIYTVGLQPRVGRNDTAAFEKYQIRDSSQRTDGTRVFYPAAARPFYYPVVFMEPPVDAASSIMGMDLYIRPNTKVAIDASIASGRAEVSAPVTLYEGGRGYILLKAIFNTATPDKAFAIRHAQATRTVSLLIRTTQFLGADDARAAAVGMRLYHNGYSRDDPKGQLYQATPAAAPAGRGLFPEFTFVRAFPNRSQPFVLETQRQVGWDIVPLPVVFAVSFVTLSMLLLVLVIFNLRRLRRDDARASQDLLVLERERAQVTLESISDAVITLAADGTVEFANPAAEQMLERPVADMRGRPVGTVVVIEVMLARATTASSFDMCARERRTVDFPAHSVLVGRNGKRLLVEGSYSPILDPSGALAGVVVVWRDMGPVRKEAMALVEAGEKRLRAHQAELAHVARLNTIGEMASGIAHEINQPLAAILSYNQACVRILEDDDAQADMTEVIAAMKAAGAQSKRAGAIIARLRAFVSKQAPRAVPVSINQVVQNALLLSEHFLREQQVTVNTSLAPELPDIVSDSIQLEQVALNLIRNATDAMRDMPPSSRRITIATLRVEQGVKVTVCDRGSGIAPEANGRLFHPFFTTKHDGMGLGLTISHTIIETYGGKLQGENSDDGGAEFSFWLPLPLSLHLSPLVQE